MAGDLIPPPSPAGRPSGDAEAERERAREREEARRRQGGLWSRSSESEPAAAGAVVEDMEQSESEPAPAAASTPSPYRSRFGLALGALLGLAIATLAIGAAAYVATGGNDATAGWSSWRPNADDGLKAAGQIAEHVGPKYRSADDEQLVGIKGGPLELEAFGLTVPLDIVMKTAAQGGDIKYIEGNSVLYTLSGLEPDGAVSGKPTTERALLLRREALELALYTFRYIEDVDVVVTLLPPAIVKQTPAAPAAPGAAASPTPTATPTATGKAAAEPKKQPQALFFRPGDLEPMLDIPLAATIPPATPNPDTLEPSEAGRIDTLTKANLFGFSYQYVQNQKAYLVLQRIAR